MIKSIALLTALAVLASAPVFAQTAAPVPTTTPAPVAAAPAAPAPTPASPAMTKDGKPAMKAVRAQCQDEVKAGGLKGDARRQAMGECIVKQRPDMASRVKCQMDPSLKGLDKDARHAAVKDCVAKAKG